MSPGLGELFSQSTSRWRPVYIYFWTFSQNGASPLGRDVTDVMWDPLGRDVMWELNPPAPDTLPFTPPFLSSFCWNPHSNEGWPNSNKISCGFSCLGNLGQVSCLSPNAAELLSLPTALVSGWGVRRSWCMGTLPGSFSQGPASLGNLQHGHHGKISEGKAMSSKGIAKCTAVFDTAQLTRAFRQNVSHQLRHCTHTFLFCIILWLQYEWEWNCNQQAGKSNSKKYWLRLIPVRCNFLLFNTYFKIKSCISRQLKTTLH